MSLQTDDIDIRDTRLWLEVGGNGDYYLNLFEVKKKMIGGDGKLFKDNVRLTTRISTSGGRASTRVLLAISELYRALEEAKMNEPASDEICRENSTPSTLTDKSK